MQGPRHYLSPAPLLPSGIAPPGQLQQQQLPGGVSGKTQREKWESGRDCVFVSGWGLFPFLISRGLSMFFVVTNT